MVGRIAFRRFLRQCHRGLPWLLCIGGHRSATAQRTGRSVGLVSYVLSTGISYSRGMTKQVPAGNRRACCTACS